MFFISLAVFIFVIDSLFKNHIEKHFKSGEEKEILHKKLLLTKHHNHGFLLNHFSERKKLLQLVSAAVFAMAFFAFVMELFKKRNYIGKLSFSFLVGGGASNLFDRMKKGYVTDYFCFLGKAPKKLKNIVFNLGDIFIFTGCVFVFIKEIFAGFGCRNS